MSLSFLRRLGLVGRPAPRPMPGPMAGAMAPRGTAPREAVPSGPPLPALAPDEPLCLVGDLHGRADLLDRLLRLRDNRFPKARMVFLGDMVDRGPDSAGVLARLRDEAAKGAICLSGNHEAMLLSFLEDPEAARGWLTHGGYETLESYRLLEQGGGDAGELAARLRRALEGDGSLDWLHSLPLWWQSGNLVAVHAGMDPSLAPAEQSQRVLQWGHEEFGRRSRPDGLWVAHGHVIVEQAFSRRGRIALDTGAYATNRLSFALVDPDLPELDRLTLAITP